MLLTMAVHACMSVWPFYQSCGPQGEALGCGAHLTALRRERIGEHSVADAWVLSDLVDAAREARETQD